MKIAIYGLPILAAVALAVGSAIYSTHRVAGIWLFYTATILSITAVFSYWHNSVSTPTTPPFQVSIQTAWVGQTRDSTYLAVTYQSGLGNTVSPVPLALFIRVVNLQDIPATVDTLRVQIQEQEGSWFRRSKWIDTKIIPAEMPLFWINSFPDDCIPAQLVGSYLTTVLEGGEIKAKGTVEGWLLLDVGPEYDHAPRPPMYRLRVRDTAGNSITTATTGPLGGNGNIQQHKRGFYIRGDQRVSLDGFTVKHWADPI